MTMPEPVSATSNAKIQTFADSSAAKYKSWMNYDERKITTADEKIWLNDTESFDTLTPKLSFVAKTVEGHTPTLSNMTPLIVWLLRYSTGADSSTVSPTATDFAAFAKDFFPDLRDALHDLNEARAEAREEGFPVPSHTALENARRLLHYMYKTLARRFEVYPTPDGEIAIDVPGNSDRSIVLLCDSDGGVLYFVHIDGVQICAQYSDANSIPDEFLPVALTAMERKD